MQRNRLVLFIFVGLLLSSCAPISKQDTVTPETRSGPTTTITPTTAATIIATATAVPTATSTPIPSATAMPSATVVPTVRATPTRYVLSETTAVDTLNPAARIKVPFVRDGDIYLYEDGIEKLVAKSTEQTTVFYPLLSPNGNYLAYIEQLNAINYNLDGRVGYLRVVDTSTGIDQPTGQEIVYYFKWTSDNLLNFNLNSEIVEDSTQVIIKELFYNPATLTETVFETVFEKESHALLSAEYPFDHLNKLIRLKNNAYYFSFP